MQCKPRSLVMRPRCGDRARQLVRVRWSVVFGGVLEEQIDELRSVG
ncbi:hypothetical protein MKSMC1_25620 [Mycobacterium kansasii]|nr:hypothetical protein MKSMC1_25620 [Mycobacterium kansasii]